MIRSSNISISSGSTTSSAILIAVTSFLPETVTETTPDVYKRQAKSLCDSLVEGGRKGISVQSAFSSEEEVQVKAIYTLKLSVPFFRPIRFQKDRCV